ncbi:hypothetical protein CEXT_630021 [Caerostris extrusa]|uniref:Uncharacterized protein n=1 Tax=Caerostris extrusa TaxID=172846 RepID=A0AAV4RZS9_CAEEX|nr:hypothetical protein CEXT_630021 [Caerostris extrusa]
MDFASFVGSLFHGLHAISGVRANMSLLHLYVYIDYLRYQSEATLAITEVDDFSVSPRETLSISSSLFRLSTLPGHVAFPGRVPSLYPRCHGDPAAMIGDQPPKRDITLAKL